MVELNLTKRQQEIFDFIKRYVGEHGYPPTVRDIGKAIGLDLVVDGARPPRATSRSSGCCGATRPSRARSRCWSTRRKQCGHADAGLPLVGQVAAGAAGARRGEHRGVRPGARRSPAATRASSCCGCKGDSMKDAGILDGRPRVVRRQETRARRRDRRRAGRARRRRSSASSARATTCASSPRTTAMEPIRTRDVQVLGRVVGLCRRVS